VQLVQLGHAATLPERVHPSGTHGTPSADHSHAIEWLIASCTVTSGARSLNTARCTPETIGVVAVRMP
jgi:hypothetical protein